MAKISFLAFLPLVLLMLFPTVNYASAHNNLNSDDQTIGNYEVQVATDPEIPEANHPFKTIIIDTIDNAYKFCTDYVLKKFKIEHESDLGFGKGYAIGRHNPCRNLPRIRIC